MDPDDNFFPLSSQVPDHDKIDISCNDNDESLPINNDSGQEDMTRTLSRFAEQAKIEESIYRKLIDELKKMANRKP
jgi:hypothetical protein